MMPFSLFLALKYLKPKRSFLSVISIISAIGVLLGVAVLIIVLSVMNGFDDMWREKTLGFNAHVMVSRLGGALDDADGLADKLAKIDGVTGVCPFVQGLVLVQHDGRVAAPFARGVEADREKQVSLLPSSIVAGRFSLEDDEIVIGRELASQLRIGVGDTLLLYSPQNFISNDEISLPSEARVAGIFEIGMYEYDLGFMLVPIELGRELCGMDGGAQAIQVMTRDPYQAAAIAGRIEKALGPDFPDVSVRTWMEMNRQFFDVLRVEKNMMFFLLIFITLVAAFGITNTLVIVVVQKTREIGLLKALGFSSGSIMRVFFWQGWIQGVIGTTLGIGLGCLTLRYRNDLMAWMSAQLHMELFPAQYYQLSEIPSRTSLSDVLTVALITLVMCTLAGLLPAYRAARLDPARALRAE
ncbi:MAG: ABC transporter permease [Lentisphaerae bacterium]|nr:ABC transporter permease [Lentisphaerota bacterium]